MSRKRVFAALLVVAGGLLVVNYLIPEPKPQTIKVVTPPAIIASLPHWVAEDQKMYVAEELKVETLPTNDSKLMVQALAAGDADVLPAVSLVDVVNACATTLTRPLIFSHSRMKADPPFEAITVLAGSPIASLKDLAGKRIAVYPGATSTAAVKAFLERNGVATDKIQFSPLAPPQHLELLQRGDVDASHIYEPLRTFNLVGGKTRMVSGSVYAYLTADSAIGVSAISSRFAKERPDAVDRYLRVWNRAIDYIRTNEKDARRILMQHLKLSQDVADRATWVDATRTDETDTRKILETAKVFQDLGVISSSVDLDDSLVLHRK